MNKENLVKYLSQFEEEQLSSNVTQIVKTALLDYLASGYGGCTSEAANSAWKFSKILFPGKEYFSLFGKKTKTSSLSACFYNSVCATNLDIDDGTRAASGHQGGVLFPATIALAQQLEISGKDFIKAIVLGYELGIRAGEILYRQSTERFFGAGTWATIGAAAACSWLLKLDPAREYLDSLGIAEAHAPFSPVMKSIATGAMVKESMAWASVTGLSSSYLAQNGFKGVESILFEDPTVPELREESYILKIYFKRYASCRWTHPMLDAIFQLKDEKKFDSEEVLEIRVNLHEKATSLSNYEPQTIYHAQYSIPFTAAVALTHDRLSHREMTPDNLGNKQILQTAQKVKMIHDPDMDAVYPGKNISSVTLKMKDGSTLQAGPIQAKGDWDRPFTDEEFHTKFIDLSNDIISSEKQRSLETFVNDLENQNLRDLII